jgi:hypothetical protein
VPLTPEERTLRAKLAAHSLHAAGGTNTGPARAAFEQRFYDAVDPDRVLPEAERERRAHHARQAFFARLSLQGARARRRKTSDNDHSAQ